MLKGKHVVLGVTGSIAAYKIANLASMLVKLHAKVTVLMTQNATNFINPITFETLTGNKCLIDTFDRNFQFNVEHVSLAKKAANAGGVMCAVYNGANEAAVELFLNNKCRFTDITELIEKAMDKCPKVKIPTLEDIFMADNFAREIVKECC